MDETGESSAGGQGVYTQNYGKGPESRGLSGPVLESTGMDGEANMAMGLSTQLVSNEVVMRSGQEQPDSDCDLFQEMGGRSGLDFLVGRGSVPGNSVKEYIFPSRAGHAAENVGAWSGMHGVPPFGSRQAQAGVGAAYPGGNIGSTGIDERQVDNIVGSTSSSSLNFVFRDCQNPHNGGRNRHSVRSNNLHSTPEIGTYGFGTPGNSTRSSACKRKSCAPVVACSSSYQSGSLRRGGLQESYDGRAVGVTAPRRSETTSSSTGARERPTLRYSSARNLANRASSSQLGAAVAAETSVHNQGINYHSLEPMSLAAPLPSNSVFPTMQTNPAAPSSSSTLRPPSHPPSLRSRLQGSTAHTLLPSMCTPGATSSRLSTPFHPSLLAPSVDSLPSAASLLQGSMLSRLSAPGVRERSFSSVAESLLGMPLRGLHLSAGDGAHQPRLVAEGLAEILLALERVERDEDLTYEQLLMLEATLLFGGMGLHDQHSDLRLDVDNMSYEELLALEERIGNVSTGVTAEVVAQKLKRSQYSSLDVVVARFSEECDIKCSICQEEYVEGDELGKIECGHGYHVSCIQQWLMQKNQCPICKAAAFS
ncbi:unnamed protein product [Sphagnum jensenii]|uniref:RING-type E3 ubiquitin transferase n=1 Tax=Sphagnum jensenii TaxID=128206 RepID=A0ABP0VP56_9BRYO